MGASALIVKDGRFINADALREWTKATGRKLNQYARFAALLFVGNGQIVAVKQEARSKWLQVCFHGLAQYEKDDLRLCDGAKLRLAILVDFAYVWRDSVTIFRADLCADKKQTMRGYLRSAAHKKLLGRRKAHSVHTTIYYQQAKRRDIRALAYDKAAKNGLNYPLVRLEFSFGRGFWAGKRETIGDAVELISFAAQRATETITRLLGGA